MKKISYHTYISFIIYNFNINAELEIKKEKTQKHESSQYLI